MCLKFVLTCPLLNCHTRNVVNVSSLHVYKLASFRFHSTYHLKWKQNGALAIISVVTSFDIFPEVTSFDIFSVRTMLLDGHGFATCAPVTCRAS